MKVQKQMWPLMVALIGVAGFIYAGWRLASAPAPDPDDAEVSHAAVDPDPGTRWGLVEKREAPAYRPFPGRVRAQGDIPIRAPQGMRVSVVKIHHEMGEEVKKGEPLITFDKTRIEKAIAQAEAAGETEKVERFKMYLDNAVLVAPEDGIVATIWTRLGEVPYDKGIPLMDLASRSSFAIVAMLPQEVVGESVPIGLKVTATVEGVEEPFEALVTSHDQGGIDQVATPVEGDHVPVSFAIDGRAGLEEDMTAIVRIPHGTQEIVLVPRAAVEWRENVAVVRVAEDGEVLEKTIRVAQDETGAWRIEGAYYVIEYGVAPGQGVIIPAVD
jgi:multidrug efflux pump subunit AcrA (membrane-fusion protein)